MSIDDLNRYLERGDHFGFQGATHIPGKLQWILLSKQKPNDRYLALLDPGEDPAFADRQEVIRERPYLVRVIEGDHAAIESERYDVRNSLSVDELHRFATLDEASAFITALGYDINQIRWRAELDVP